MTASRFEQHQPASSDSLLGTGRGCRKKSADNKIELNQECKLDDRLASTSERQVADGQQSKPTKPVYSISRMTQMARVSTVQFLLTYNNWRMME